MIASAANRQTESAECGLACLAMVAAARGSDIDLAWLRQRRPASSRGSTVQDLIDTAASIGLAARPLRCEPVELSSLRLPAILHWNLNHFVVLLGMRRGGRARIFDPATGERIIGPEQVSRNFTGVALELSPTEGFQRRTNRSPLRLLSLVRWDRVLSGALAQVIVLSLLLQAYMLASPFYLQTAIDNAALKGDGSLLSSLAIGFAAFAVVNAFAEFFRILALQRITALLSWDVTRRLFHHLVRLPLPWFQRRQLADVLTRFQAVEPLKALIANGLVAALVDGAMSVTTAAMMFVFAPVLGAVTLVGFAVYALLRLASMPLTLRLASESMVASIAEQSKRLEVLRAIQTVKVMSGEAQREADWANKLAETIRTSQRSAIASSGIATLQRLIDGLAYVVVVFLGVRAVMGAHLTVGLLYAFLVYRSQFLARADSLFEQAVSWRLLDIYTYRLADIVLTPIEAVDEPSRPGLPAIRGAVELQHVGFRFAENDPPLLRSVSLRIEPGEFVAIVGPSGAGKSTLLKILCGLYPPTVGQVLVDGLQVSKWGPRALRQSLGVVMQDDDLLPGSIAENVAFFDEHLDLEAVLKALEQAALRVEVEAMPMGVHTLVGDMGSTLSGGEKQRVLLARALYRRPRILVLDEATSHLDILRERRISASLQQLKITRIVVAHRPETIAAADRVLVLDGGVCRELRRDRGPAELASQTGLGQAG